MAKNSRKVIRKAAKDASPKPGRNPPKEFRYPRGFSGNPLGRPPGSKNLKTIILEAARDQVMATVNGKPRKISKLQATAMQLATKAASGDHKAMSKFLALVDEFETRAAAERPTQFPLSEPDLEILLAVYLRMIQCEAPKSEA